MSLAIIAAIGKNNVIGKDNDLPWHIPEDLKHFKNLTLGKTIIMGRKTFESLPALLPNRNHIVISRTLKAVPGVLVFQSLSQALEKIENNPAITMFIIGGGELFKEALPLVDKMYLTYVDVEVEEPTTKFPKFNSNDWQTTDKQSIISQDGIKCAFKTLIRNK